MPESFEPVPELHLRRDAARAVRFADGRSESVGESRSQVILHRWKLAPSALQFEIRSPDGALIGRTDVAWERQRLVGEFDGRITRTGACSSPDRTQATPSSVRSAARTPSVRRVGG
jgi:hypothetical protein